MERVTLFNHWVQKIIFIGLFLMGAVNSQKFKSSAQKISIGLQPKLISK
jgi:hypothetical protein